MNSSRDGYVEGGKNDDCCEASYNTQQSTMRAPSSSSAAVAAAVVVTTKAVSVVTQTSPALWVSKECWHLVGSYLGFEDLWSLPQVSVQIKNHFDEPIFWQHFLLAQLLPAHHSASTATAEPTPRTSATTTATTAATQEVSSTTAVDATATTAAATSAALAEDGSDSLRQPAITLQVSLVEQPVSLFVKVWEHLNSGRVYDIAKCVTAVSSLDRAEESPENVMKLSSCFYFLKSPNRAQKPLHYQQLVYEGYRIQRQCGCAGGRPCYWSSRPSTSQRTFEYLRVELCTAVSCLAGFSVTPYQAFFHPNAPVYGPMQVAIQILAPAANKSCISISDAVMQSTTAAAGSGSSSSSSTSNSSTSRAELLSSSSSSNSSTRSVYKVQPLTHAETMRDVYFQSDFFAVENVFEKQVFFLKQPVLCVGGEVRIIFRGMQMRQTLGFHLFPEDFYLCISNVGVLAVPFEGYQIRSDPTAARKQQQQQQQQQQQEKQSSSIGQSSDHISLSSADNNAGVATATTTAARTSAESQPQLQLECERVSRVALCRVQAQLLDMNALRQDRQEDHAAAVVCAPFLKKHQSESSCSHQQLRSAAVSTSQQNRKDLQLAAFLRNTRLSSADSDLQYSSAKRCNIS